AGDAARLAGRKLERFDRRGYLRAQRDLARLLRDLGDLVVRMETLRQEQSHRVAIVTPPQIRHGMDRQRADDDAVLGAQPGPQSAADVVPAADGVMETLGRFIDRRMEIGTVLQPVADLV